MASRSRRPSPPDELKESVAALRLKAALGVDPARPLKRTATSRTRALLPNPSEQIIGRIGPPPVPHINQTRPDGAGPDYVDIGRCAPTCMAMLARAYGLGSTLSDAELVERLSRIAGTAENWGTDRKGLYRMAAHLKLKSLDWNGEATFWMARQLEQERYIIAAGNPFVLPPFEKLEGYGGHVIVVDGMDHAGNFLMKNPWPDGVHVVAPEQMWKFLMTTGGLKPYQYAFWR